MQTQKLLKAIGEFRSYVESNAAVIPNYGDRPRYSERDVSENCSTLRFREAKFRGSE